MRRWLDFVGGLLVGFGVATYVFLALVAVVLHHMFIMGITQPLVEVFLLSAPAFLILLGVALATVRRRAA